MRYLRRAARVDGTGALVPLELQDRGLWDQDQIAEGLGLLEAALKGRSPGPYQLQAAVAALHAQAPRPEATDWQQVAALYGRLVRLVPTPVVALNHAVAVGMAQGCALGLEWVDRLGSAGELEGYALYHAARADLLRRLGRMAEAAAAYEQALERTTNSVERVYLDRRIREVAPDLPSTPVENPG